MDDCRLTDLGYHGLLYTWDNKQDDGPNVKVRLDRALGDDKFMMDMGESGVFHIPLAESDHCAMLIEVRESLIPGGRRQRRKPKPFHYENMWKSHGEYNEFVNHAWDLGPGASDLSAMSSALTSLQGSLKSWDAEVFGSVKGRLSS